METLPPVQRALARHAHALAIARGDKRLREASLDSYVRARWPFVITIVDHEQADLFIADWSAVVT
jgi:hypothetical protein